MKRRSILLPLIAAAAGCGGVEAPYDLDGGDLLTAGKLFADKRGCATCHQSPNAADGVLSGQSTPLSGTMTYGSNLTPDPATGIGAWADIELVRAMRYGIDNKQMRLCPTMTHYDGTDPSQPSMSDLEGRAIVAYLRSLPAVARPAIPISICPPIKTPPQDMAIPATDDAGAPPVQDDLSVAPAPDLAAPPDITVPIDSAAGPIDAGSDGGGGGG